MARVTLTKTAAPGSYAAAGVLLTETACDISNLNQFAPTGNDLIMVHNSGASPYTFTVTSAADPYGRTKDVTTESIAAGDIRIFGPVKTLGWVQTDGFVYLQGSNAAVKFGIISV